MDFYDDDTDGETGETLKAKGMALAEKNAQEEWKEGYRKHAEVFLANQPYGKQFTCEDIHIFLRPLIGEPKNTSNSWGAMSGSILKTWFKAGRIQEGHGWVPAKRKKSHARRDRCYVKVRATYIQEVKYG